MSVPKGAFLDVCYGSANHDETVFPEPERFDIQSEAPPLRVAFGAHNCLGQVLARLEMGRALNAMLDNMPGVRLNPDAPPPQMRGAMMRTPHEIHVLFD